MINPIAIRRADISHHAEIASKTPEDLQNLKDRLDQLKTQKDRIQADIAATEETLSQKRGELSRLEADTFADIDARVRGCLEAEKAIQLLDSRLGTLKTMCADTDATIATTTQSIKELATHLEIEAYTQEVERFLCEEYLPHQEAHIQMRLKLNRLLTAAPHYLKVGQERLRTPGQYEGVLPVEAGDRKYRYQFLDYDRKTF